MRILPSRLGSLATDEFRTCSLASAFAYHAPCFHSPPSNQLSHICKYNPSAYSTLHVISVEILMLVNGELGHCNSKSHCDTTVRGVLRIWLSQSDFLQFCRLPVSISRNPRQSFTQEFAHDIVRRIPYSYV